MPPRNIVLTGFMGTGKSTVGALVADFIGWSFVDADDEIETRTGRKIPQIFAEDGEQAFRRIEKAVCQSLAARTQVVIATGGGMLVDDENRSLMLSSGLVVCLNADPDAIAARVGRDRNRPLLQGDWRELFERRKAAYAAIPNQLDTTNKTPTEIAREVIWLYRIETDLHLG